MQGRLTSFGIVLALGVVASTWLVTDAMRDIRMSHQIIKVRGYSEVPVESDLVVWDITLRSANTELTSAYATLAEFRGRTLEFLTQQGLDPSDTKSGIVYVSEVKRRNEKGLQTNEIEGYALSQVLTVKSAQVLKVDAAAGNVSALLGEGVMLQAGSPQFSFTGIGSLKSQLLVDATQDARERAQTLASGSGVKLGPLRAARQGVFSLQAADASGISEQSREDTASIAKKVTAVVTVDYAMK